MSSKPLEVRVLITELPTLVEKKSKQTDLNDTPEPMSSPFNDLPYKKSLALKGQLYKFNIFQYIFFKKI